jgi:ribulose-phosphate 3-epimerase
MKTLNSVRPANPDSWRQAEPVVLPSLLLCDFGNLEREIGRLEEAGVQAFHLDVMDGHFVDNLTYGLPIVAAARRITRCPLDVHLMISEPAKYVDRFIDAGADAISFHIEADREPRRVLSEIRTRGVLAGIALNPPTPLESIEPVLDDCDFVLVMSVMPGFGRQAFQEVALSKLRRLRKLAGDRLLLEIDGGVNSTTIAACGAAGAQLFVAGSAIFGQQDYGKIVASLVKLAEEGKGSKT